MSTGSSALAGERAKRVARVRESGRAGAHRRARVDTHLHGAYYEGAWELERLSSDDHCLRLCRVISLRERGREPTAREQQRCCENSHDRQEQICAGRSRTASFAKIYIVRAIDNGRSIKIGRLWPRGMKEVSIQPSRLGHIAKTRGSAAPSSCRTLSQCVVFSSANSVLLDVLNLPVKSHIGCG